MAQEDVRNWVSQLHRLPGLALVVNNVHKAMQAFRVEGLAQGLDLTCIAGLSPMEVYVVNKAHPAVASVLGREGLPPPPRLVSGPAGRESSGESADQSVHQESPGEPEA